MWSYRCSGRDSQGFQRGDKLPQHTPSRQLNAPNFSQVFAQLSFGFRQRMDATQTVPQYSAPG